MSDSWRRLFPHPASANCRLAFKGFRISSPTGERPASHTAAFVRLRVRVSVGAVGELCFQQHTYGWRKVPEASGCSSPWAGPPLLWSLHQSRCCTSENSQSPPDQTAANKKKNNQFSYAPTCLKTMVVAATVSTDTPGLSFSSRLASLEPFHWCFFRNDWFLTVKDIQAFIWACSHEALRLSLSHLWQNSFLWDLIIDTSGTNTRHQLKLHDAGSWRWFYSNRKQCSCLSDSMKTFCVCLKPSWSLSGCAHTETVQLGGNTMKNGSLG